MAHPYETTAPSQIPPERPLSQQKDNAVTPTQPPVFFRTNEGPKATNDRHAACKKLIAYDHEPGIATTTPTISTTVTPPHICDSTSNTNNVEIIQVQLNKLTVTSVYKPPNEQFSFGSNLASTQMNVVIGDFNSRCV